MSGFASLPETKFGILTGEPALLPKSARIGRPFRRLVTYPRLGAMLEMAPRTIPPPSLMDDPQVVPAVGERRIRVALMTGCAQRVVDTDINAATIRLMTRHGAEVVIARGMGCCGALTHHMGRVDDSHGSAAGNIGGMMQIGGAIGLLVVHMAALLDRATRGRGRRSWREHRGRRRF